VIQTHKILGFLTLTAALLIPIRAAAQSGTVTDDAFLASDPITQVVNLNGQGISLIVAGPNATDCRRRTTAHTHRERQPSAGSDTAFAVSKISKIYRRITHPGLNSRYRELKGNYFREGASHE
jgi:hypothetical protein